MRSFKSRFMNIVLRLLGAKKMFAAFRAAEGSQSEFQAAVANVRSQSAYKDDPPDKLTEKYPYERELIDGSALHIHKVGQGNKVVLFLHGGAYVLGLGDIYWSFIEILGKETNATIAVFDYPLAPEHHAETAVSRTVQAYDFLLSRYAPEDIIVMGDSAGGGLAAALLHALRDQKRPLPAKGILLYPWLDVTMPSPEARAIEKNDLLLSVDGLITCGKYYTGELDPTHPFVSPFYGEPTGLPPIVTLTGTWDVLHPQGKEFAEKVKAAGGQSELHIFPEMQHAWLLFGMPETTDALNKIATAVNQ